MITAHAPSGHLLYKLWPSHKAPPLAACVIGAVLPDFDLIWFFFIDNGAIHHHRYWIHAPGFWLICLLIFLPILSRVAPSWRLVGYAIFAGWFLHLCLDSIVGSIMWAWPISDHFFQITTVPARYDHYLLSFMLHWSFLVEIAIWASAAWLWFGHKK